MPWIFDHEALNSHSLIDYFHSADDSALKPVELTDSTSASTWRRQLLWRCLESLPLITQWMLPLISLEESQVPALFTIPSGCFITETKYSYIIQCYFLLLTWPTSMWGIEFLFLTRHIALKFEWFKQVFSLWQTFQVFFKMQENDIACIICQRDL